MSRDLNIGFIGFGEVAYQFMKGIAPQLKGKIAAYDVAMDNPMFSSKIKERANEVNIELLGSPANVASQCDVIFGAVPAAFTLDAASQIVPHLTTNHTYLDVSAAHPEVKKKIAEMVLSKGATFCDIAITGPVKLLGHKVPMMASGHIPPKVYTALTQLGMQIEVISDKAGEASAIKLCRSIFTKGLEALLVETVLVAQSMNVDRKVLESIEHTLSQQSFLAAANRYITGNAIHAERRVHEVEEVVSMMGEFGIEPLVTSGVLNRMKWCAERDGRKVFGLEQPALYGDVIDYYLNYDPKKEDGDKHASHTGW
ncbi:NAD(P)-dependent oxidoreductase [Tepidibacillus sp. HK-1]|uniref:NAD(P)-dependent oxidoreductase n=1 Tax=Tepidibacillus sp. HK-1 TaxID=1883407 RepID=UPI0008536B3E|nr:NAD(P)-dependent oxidoreductase [Tepidibacillus sp. HK-1]GBF12237.1 NAD binding domain of 6-phosphogluconate dehydrogenase [Tepidibacillus sp. HK-1]